MPQTFPCSGKIKMKNRCSPKNKILYKRGKIKMKKWIESLKAAQAKNESAKESIFAACYEKNVKKLEIAIKAYHESKRAVDGWTNWIGSDDESRTKLAQEKARNACIKFAQRIGKIPASVLQFADDAAQESLLFIYYEIENASERAPESILSYIAGKYISSYYYRSAGRNGKDESLDEYESIDSFLYGHNAFGPGPENALLALDSMEEIISDIKPIYQEESRIIIDALKAGYSQTEIASAMNTSQQIINYRIQQIKAAARIVTERNIASAEIEKQIESDENAISNMAIRSGQRPRK